jgi:hypothetical protein
MSYSETEIAAKLASTAWPVDVRGQFLPKYVTDGWPTTLMLVNQRRGLPVRRHYHHADIRSLGELWISCEPLGSRNADRTSLWRLKSRRWPLASTGGAMTGNWPKWVKANLLCRQRFRADGESAGTNRQLVLWWVKLGCTPQEGCSWIELARHRGRGAVAAGGRRSALDGTGSSSRKLTG